MPANPEDATRGSQRTVRGTVAPTASLAVLLGLAVASIALVAGWIVLTAPRLRGRASVAGLVLLVSTVALSTCLGIVVLVRGRHPVGWALLSIAGAASAGAGAGNALLRALPASSAGNALAWLQAWSPVVGATGLAAAVLLFPLGWAPRRRRATGAVLGAGAALVVIGVILRPGALRPAFGMGGVGPSNPTGVAGLRALAGAAVVMGTALVALGFAGALVIGWQRYRTTSDGDRDQVSWFAFPSAAAAGVAVVAALGARLDLGPAPRVWQLAASAGAFAAVAGFCVAVVRHRAFGIYRSVGYMADYRIWTFSTALLTLGAVLGLGTVIPSALGVGARAFAVAVATLAAAAIAWPVWRRRQNAIDRRFGQRQLDPAERLERFVGDIETAGWDRSKIRGPVFDLLAGFAPVVVAQGEGGMRFAVRTSDREVGRHTFVHGGYELDTMRRAIRLLTERGGRPDGVRGGVVIDVGANIGTSVIPAIALFGATSALAIEPAPGNVELLRVNLELNGLTDRVRVLPIALSDRDGTLELELSDANSGDNRLRVPGTTGGIEERRPANEVQRPVIEVQVRPFDAVLEDCALDPRAIALVWMDVQGHEGHVLAGASMLLAAGVPIVTECWPAALRRSGGWEMFCDLVGAHFRSAIDLRGDGGERELPARRIAEFAATYDGPERFTDLLLLP